MKHISRGAAAVLLLLVAGCAKDVSRPTAIQVLPPAQLAMLRISDISVDAPAGVEAYESDFDLIAAKVRGFLQLETPNVLVTSGTADRLVIHLTRFDHGNAAARSLSFGLGQIRIEATVVFIDPAGRQIGRYAVSKDFAFGGTFGSATAAEDVVDGFAKSIVEIVKGKA